MSPEILSDLPYSKASDMWSLGVLLYELITTKMPFKDAQQILNPNTKYLPIPD